MLCCEEYTQQCLSFPLYRSEKPGLQLAGSRAGTDSDENRGDCRFAEPLERDRRSAPCLVCVHLFILMGRFFLKK